MKRNYRITPEQYNKMLEKQNGVCAICKKKETKKNGWGNIKRLQIDHNHKTGRIRGLVCFNCNCLLGLCYNNIEILKNAIYYLNPMEKIR